MMQGMRDAGKTWLGKLLVGLMFGLLILSFGIWGIGDMLGGIGRNTVVTVGRQEIGVDQVRTAYQNEIQNLTRRLRRNVSSDLARQLGLDQQVIGKLVAEAALDERVADLGLAITDETIRSAILADRAFKGPSGNFERAIFDQVIRDNGFTEQSFVREQRRVYLRQHLAEAIAGGAGAPVALKEALHRIRFERRMIDYVVLDAGKVPPATPDETALAAFFDARKADFRAPEYRSAQMLWLTPDALAKPLEIPEGEIRAQYDRIRTTRFGSPERRQVQQLTFPTTEAAGAASARLKEASATFEAIAQEVKATPADYDLGRITRADLLDPAIAERVFALPAPGMTDPIPGRFGIVIARVVTIEPESVRSFDEVSGIVRADLANAIARRQVQDFHGKIEDQRASARPLAEIASGLGLKLVAVSGMDAQGLDVRGKLAENLPVQMPAEREIVMRAVFATDIGVDTEPLQIKDGGWVWYDVTRIDPPRERALEEVRDAVIARWREDDVRLRLAQKADGMLAIVRGGKALGDVAMQVGVSETRKADGIRRETATGDISAAATALIFATAVGDAGTATALNGRDRIVFVVGSATMPPFVTTTQEAVQSEEQLRVALGQDLVTQYIARLQADLGVRINSRVLAQAIGGVQ